MSTKVAEFRARAHDGRQLSAADIRRRPPGFLLPADVDRDPADRAVQRPVRPLRHLEEPRQGEQPRASTNGRRRCGT